MKWRASILLLLLLLGTHFGRCESAGRESAVSLTLSAAKMNDAHVSVARPERNQNDIHAEEGTNNTDTHGLSLSLSLLEGERRLGKAMY